MVTVRELMQETTANVHVGHALSEAHERMGEYNLAALPVLDGDEIVGLIHLHDTKDTQNKLDSSGAEEMVIDHIIAEVSFCYDDDNVNTALATMLATGHEVLVVTNANRKLAGIISYEMIDRAGGVPDEAPASGETTQSRQVGTGGHAHGDSPGKPARYSSEPELREAQKDSGSAEAVKQTDEEEKDGQDKQY